MLFDSDSDDEDIYDMLEYFNRRKRPTFRPRINYFEEFDELDFFKRFRLMKTTVTDLLGIIGDRLERSTNRNHAVLPYCQLLMALRYYATGGSFTTIGDFGGVHESTACHIVHDVSKAIASLRPIYIKMPQSPIEICQAQNQFYKLARFSRVIGALDCTHVKIISPGGPQAEHFRNRKGFFSLNVQTVSDANLKILDIVARWPGENHDVNVFNSSALRARLELGHMGNSVLVADSGYGCRNYLLTPLPNTHTPAEELYNESLIRTRNVVERQYGVWKRRFPVLATGMACKLENVQAIIVATAVLHNIACTMNEEEPPPDPELPNDLNYENDQDPQAPVANMQEDVRNILIHQYFSQLAMN